MKTVTLICGLPNAGKSNYSKNFDNVFHLDDFDDAVFKITFLKCNYAASQSDGDVCVEGCYHKKSLRKEFLENFKDYKKVCIWMNTPLEVCLERSEEKNNRTTVMLMSKIFEPPTEEEGWDELIVVDYDKV